MDSCEQQSDRSKFVFRLVRRPSSKLFLIEIVFEDQVISLRSYLAAACTLIGLGILLSEIPVDT